MGVQKQTGWTKQRKGSENPVDENDASNLLPSTESYRSMGEILSSMDPGNHLPMPVIESGSGKQTITLSDRHSSEGAMWVVIFVPFTT